jgi:PAS domain S-box-containing protein
MSTRQEIDIAIPQRLAGRTAAALFLVGGVVGVLTPFLPSDSHVAPYGVIIAGVAALISGLIIWRLPWDASPPSRSLLLVPIAFSYIALGNHFAGAEPFRYSIYFVVAFMWIGIAHPPRTSLAFAPLFAAAYLLPFYTSGNVSITGLSSIAVVGPCCVVLGETVAWLTQRARSAQAAFHRELGEHRFRSMAQNSFDVLLILDAHGRITYASPALHRILGYVPAESVGRNFLELLDPADHPRLVGVFRDLRAQPGALKSLEFRIRSGSGGWRIVQAMGKNLLDDPAVEGLLIDLRDITEQKTLEEQLKHQAFHDPLTGLANRALFSDRVEHAVARLQRSDGDLAVLCLDLDDFKTVNDSLGHAAGDLLLVQVAERIREHVRPGDTGSPRGR